MIGMLSGMAVAAEKTTQRLRNDAATLYDKADKLTEKALKKESSSDVKSRGYGSHRCVMDCIKSSRSLYSCRRACGSY